MRPFSDAVLLKCGEIANSKGYRVIGCREVQKGEYYVSMKMEGTVMEGRINLFAGGSLPGHQVRVIVEKGLPEPIIRGGNAVRR